MPDTPDTLQNQIVPPRLGLRPFLGSSVHDLGSSGPGLGARSVTTTRPGRRGRRGARPPPPPMCCTGASVSFPTHCFFSNPLFLFQPTVSFPTHWRPVRMGPGPSRTFGGSIRHQTPEYTTEYYQEAHLQTLSHPSTLVAAQNVWSQCFFSNPLAAG